MPTTLSASARKVQEALHAFDVICQVIELPDSTRSARDAAQAIGCEVGQIVKSLVFKGARSGKPILVLTSGSNRVNEKTLEKFVAEPIKKADATFVREKTGFAIGGIPPLGHTEKPETYLDADLLRYEEIWAAAGTPHAVFKLTPQDLQKITDGQIVSVK